MVPRDHAFFVPEGQHIVPIFLLLSRLLPLCPRLSQPFYYLIHKLNAAALPRLRTKESICCPCPFFGFYRYFLLTC